MFEVLVLVEADGRVESSLYQGLTVRVYTSHQQVDGVGIIDLQREHDCSIVEDAQSTETTPVLGATWIQTSI